MSVPTGNAARTAPTTTSPSASSGVDPGAGGCPKVRCTSGDPQIGATHSGLESPCHADVLLAIANQEKP